ncbi:MAG: hypothetical protein CM15mP120_02280 [Pseudomonadota bacterium]|nr:MAG: hypothetical protein CM15mP120_02280 [Pseudomonadota bacterium]
MHFHSVQIISEDPDGVWVTGLPNETNLITVGQEMVVAGERVDPDLQTFPLVRWLDRLPQAQEPAGNYNV